MLEREETIGNLRRFERDAEVFDGLERSLMHEFANEWVAFYHGKVVSHGATLEEVLLHMQEKGIRPERAIVRFLDPDPPPIV
jgi:hypothetical protein